MAPSNLLKKRKGPDGPQGKANRPTKKSKKQLEYHSSSDEQEEDDEPSDFQAVNLADSEDDEESVDKKKNMKTIGSQGTSGRKNGHKDADSNTSDDNNDDDDEEVDEDDDDGDDEETGSEASIHENDSDSDSDDSISKMNTKHDRGVPKRNDPAAFSTSISKILTTKLPASARSDPVLSRSKSAADVRSEFANEKLDKLARAKLRAEKREELDRGRVRDVMGIERGHAGQVTEEEKRFRKIAQRGVVKLFNAVRTAQVRGEEAARSERRKGTIGIDERTKSANEISKQGFLELIGGKKGKQVNIEEA